MSNGHEELLRHDAFLRRLSRGLAGPAERADDLAQETWLAALRARTAPRDAGALRSWLARVARNLAIRGSERESARRARERVAALCPREAMDRADPAAIDARMALQHRLAEAVDALREPYRTVVFLRYFEGLAPAEIARRTAAPQGTVKTRLKRALAQLRERLDRENGGREAWSVLLAGERVPGGPLGGPLDGPLGAIGGSAMAMKGVLAGSAGVAVLAAGAWWLIPLSGETPGKETAGATVALDPAAAPGHSAGGEVELVARVPGQAPERAPAEAAGPAEPALAPVPAASPPTPPEPPLELHGRVVHAQGPPAADANVLLGSLRATTDRGGRFRLRLGPGGLGSRGTPDADLALVAVKESWSPAVLPGFGARALDAARRDERVELVLPGEAGTIDGFVLGADGAPGEGWRVKLLDATVIAEGDFFPLTAEEVAADPSGSYVLDQRRAEGAPASAWRRGYEETDAEGRFAFGGLELGRTYRLRAWNARTLEVVESKPVPTNASGVVLQAPMDPPRPIVDGVVVGTDGTPLEGVRCRLILVEHRTGPPTISRLWMTTGQEVRTDADGGFLFRDVPHTELFLRFHGHDGESRLDLAAGEAYRGVRVVIERPGFLRVEGAQPERGPDHVAVLDEAGERLRMEFSPEPDRTSSVVALQLRDGRTPQAKVRESACWLVLLRDGKEIGRRGLAVVPGELTVVRL